ncbi:siderophore-interacting protein [Nocardioides sp. HDW12B]|uniref:siderophore-interacting protein n=1 Tax=Nocardioides sp. HDW12B TaxID=2714939 RepID=UPI001F0EDF05|nr:siderophore-interacting protein [Nocardioides sp. HDW12B]
MTARSVPSYAEVLRRERLSPHLVRLVLGGDDLAGFASTGMPDEWVGLVVPGQFQSRYYTVRSWDGEELVLDVVLHPEGLVTEWARRDVVGERVTVLPPKGSFALPDDARWVRLVGDLTAMPAMARISETLAERVGGGLDLHLHAEVPDELPGYLPQGTAVTWVAGHGSGLADVVTATTWPEGPGYFWMAGESAQMRAIRKHLSRELRWPSTAYDVMGYWRAVARRQPRAVDPGPIWREGKAAGRSDAEIWAAYDAAQEAQDAEDGPA